MRRRVDIAAETAGLSANRPKPGRRHLCVKKVFPSSALKPSACCLHGKGFVVLFLLLVLFGKASGQQIDFGTYVPPDNEHYEIVLDVQQDLDFGLIIMGQPAETIEYTSLNAGVIEIEAVRYLDLFVDITEKPASLWLDGDNTDEENRIPLQLEFAYANTQDGLAGSRTLFTGNMARFPVRQRPGGPPRPPPVPPHSGYVPPRATAYLIVGGTLGDGTIPSGIDAGSYSAQITIEVSYDL